MKLKIWIIAGLVAITSIMLAFYLVVFATRSNYASEDWRTMAETYSSDGGHCFVRQKSSSILFSDVMFGYIDRSGAKYCFTLENDGFHWGNARLTKRDGIVHVWRGHREEAAFNPSLGCFTNLVMNFTDNATNRLYSGQGSSFFRLQPRMNVAW
jgi:hypothetical protein